MGSPNIVYGNWIVQTPCTYHSFKFTGAVSWALMKLKGYYFYVVLLLTF